MPSGCQPNHRAPPPHAITEMRHLGSSRLYTTHLPFKQMDANDEQTQTPDRILRPSAVGSNGPWSDALEFKTSPYFRHVQYVATPFSFSYETVLRWLRCTARFDFQDDSTRCAQGKMESCSSQIRTELFVEALDCLFESCAVASDVSCQAPHWNGTCRQSCRALNFRKRYSQYGGPDSLIARRSNCVESQ